jgi:hypothetical protein
MLRPFVYEEHGLKLVGYQAPQEEMHLHDYRNMPRLLEEHERTPRCGCIDGKEEELSH